MTIDAGIEVRFWAGTSLSVTGTLDVNGVSGSEVSFLSDADTPAAGDWTGLVLGSASSGTLDYATVRHASIGVDSTGGANLTEVALVDGQTGVQIAGGSATLSQVTTSDNTNYGVYVTGGTSVTLVTLSGLTSQRNDYGLYVWANSTVDVSGSTLTDNTTSGVLTDGAISYAPALTIGGSSIHSNLGSHDLWAQRYLNAGEQVLQATGNWWGSTEEATIALRDRRQLLQGRRQPISAFSRFT